MDHKAQAAQRRLTMEYSYQIFSLGQFIKSAGLLAQRQFKKTFYKTSSIISKLKSRLMSNFIFVTSQDCFIFNPHNFGYFLKIFTVSIFIFHPSLPLIVQATEVS